jgi:hypothetical protein
VVNREVVAINVDEASLAETKARVLAALAADGHDITPVHDGKTIEERLRLKVPTITHIERQGEREAQTGARSSCRLAWSVWPQCAYKGPSSRMQVANGYETAFYIMDVDVVLRKHRQWLALLNRVKIRYGPGPCRLHAVWPAMKFPSTHT